MGVKVEKTKWVLYRNFKDYELFKELAVYVKEECGNIGSNQSRYEMRDWLASINKYHTRHPKVRPLDSQHHKVRTLEYYMVGYDAGTGANRKFVFSPLGNLFVHYVNDEDKLSKVFATMMFAMQFTHPCNRIDPKIQIFPMRLLFQLMTDTRLGKKLYFIEYVRFVACLEKITPARYEKLVQKILEYRALPNDKQFALLKRKKHYSLACYYELDGFTSKLFESAGIFIRHEGETIGKLSHPHQKWAVTKETKRSIKKGYITINESVEPFIIKMLSKYSCFEKPIRFDNPKMLRSDLVKQVYNFYPDILANELDEDNEFEKSLLKLPQLIEEYANNPNNETALLFEDVLEEGFNMFCDVEANKIGGPGHTDVECLWITMSKKFVVEAKATKTKLQLVNTQRLKEHRDEVGGQYTILITPRYVPAAKRDIRNTPIVIITAHTFSEYLYNHLYHDVRDLMYEDFDNIIKNHLGEDVSKLISNITIEKFSSKFKKAKQNSTLND